MRSSRLLRFAPAPKQSRRRPLDLQAPLARARASPATIFKDTTAKDPRRERERWLPWKPPFTLAERPPAGFGACRRTDSVWALVLEAEVATPPLRWLCEIYLVTFECLLYKEIHKCSIYCTASFGFRMIGGT